MATWIPDVRGILRTHADMRISDPIRKKRSFGNLSSALSGTGNRVAMPERIAEKMDAVFYNLAELFGKVLSSTGWSSVQ